VIIELCSPFRAKHTSELHLVHFAAQDLSDNLSMDHGQPLTWNNAWNKVFASSMVMGRERA
jgi:hypothetical protein